MDVKTAMNRGLLEDASILLDTYVHRKDAGRSTLTLASAMLSKL